MPLQGQEIETIARDASQTRTRSLPPREDMLVPPGRTTSRPRLEVLPFAAALPFWISRARPRIVAVLLSKRLDRPHESLLGGSRSAHAASTSARSRHHVKGRLVKNVTIYRCRFLSVR